MPCISARRVSKAWLVAQREGEPPVLFKRFVSLLIVSAVIVCPAQARTAAAQDNHATAHAHIGTANAGPGLEKPEEYKSDLAIATFIVFLVLLAILWKFAWGPIVAA